jgi:hypothetical protein
MFTRTHADWIYFAHALAAALLRAEPGPIQSALLDAAKGLNAAAKLGTYHGATAAVGALLQLALEHSVLPRPLHPYPWAVCTDASVVFADSCL